MSDLKQEVRRGWRRFSEEFKRDALRLVVEEGYTFKAAAAAVGVSDQTLRAWHAKLVPPPSHAARMPRSRSFAQRISVCVESCVGPRWSVRS
jgi:transposase-like protein